MALTAVWVLPTLRCDMACPYCFSEFHVEIGAKNRAELDRRRFIDFIDTLRAGGDEVLALISGGEPFLYEELPELLRELDARAVAIHLTTNWTRLREGEIAMLNELRRVKVYLSCHARWKEIRDFLGLYRSTFRFPYAVSQVVNRGNLRRARELSQWCAEERVPFLPQMLSPNDEPPLEAVSYKSFADEDWETASEVFGANQRDQFLSRWRLWESERRLLGGCPVDNRAYVVYASGAVYPCFFRSDTLLGNVHQTPPAEIVARHRAVRIDPAAPVCAAEACNCLYRVPGSSAVYMERPLWGNNVD